MNNTEYEKLCRDHAAQIIDFMAFQVSSNWQECLDLAEAEFEMSQSPLWLAVCDGLRALIRQQATAQSECLLAYLAGKDDVPF
ncbi:hypothetical protein LA6_003698 [Marinibacterium anthonyi]|nr:hypothetical protein LA6_003698 [Marinibacterium anthonyi]